MSEVNDNVEPIAVVDASDDATVADGTRDGRGVALSY
jgi:hypothetical protein